MQRKVQEVVTFEEITRACDAPDIRCIVLKFGARWCTPCQEVAPMVKQWLAEEAPQGVAILSVDADDADSILDHYSIMKLPTFVLLCRDGTIASRLQTSDFAKVRIEITDHLERTSRSAPDGDF